MSSRGVLRDIPRNENAGRPSNSRRLTIPEKIEAQKKMREQLSITVLKVGENSDEIKALGNTLKEQGSTLKEQGSTLKELRLLLHQTTTRLEKFDTLVAAAKAASTKTGEDVENVGKMLESLEEKQTAQATTLSGVIAELSCELQAVNRLGENIEILDATQKVHTQTLANIAAGIANNANFAAERATEDTGAARAAAGNGASLDDFKQLRNAIERNSAAIKRGERTSASGQSDMHAQLRALRVAAEQRASRATCGLNQAAASFFPSKPTAARVARDEAWPVVGS